MQTISANTVHSELDVFVLLFGDDGGGVTKEGSQDRKLAIVELWFWPL
jgi:hypothetical protein